MLVNGGVDLTEKPIWIEGPHLYKINGNYFLMCAEGGTSVNHREVIFRGDSPIGKFKPWTKNPILTQKHLDPQRKLPITCAGHADLIKKDIWSVVVCFPGLPDRLTTNSRTWGAKLTSCLFIGVNDGFPFMTKGDELVPRIIQMEGVKRDSTVTFGNFEKVDDFDSAELGMEVDDPARSSCRFVFFN